MTRKTLFLAFSGFMSLGLWTQAKADTGTCELATYTASQGGEVIIKRANGDVITLEPGRSIMVKSCSESIIAKDASAPLQQKSLALDSSAPLTPHGQAVPTKVSATAQTQPPASPSVEQPVAGDVKPDTKKSTLSEDAADPKTPAGIYAGAGAGLSVNLGSRRADAVKYVTRSDGQLLAQVQTSQDTNVNVLLETHYLFDDKTVFLTDGFSRNPADWIEAVAACGPFAFARKSDERGCGPLFVASLDTHGVISQFGGGWALGLGKKDPMTGRRPFGLGIGFLVDTSDQVVDGRIIDTSTMLVRAPYKDAITSGTLSGLVKRSTVSAFVMVSKTF